MEHAAERTDYLLSYLKGAPLMFPLLMVVVRASPLEGSWRSCYLSVEVPHDLLLVLWSKKGHPFEVYSSWKSQNVSAKRLTLRACRR
jgi:hypothetical protein